MAPILLTITRRTNEVAVATTMDPQDILDNISTGIIALNADLAVTAINSAGEALLQLSEARYRGLHASQMLSQAGD